MKRNFDIFRIDNILITAGCIFLFLVTAAGSSLVTELQKGLPVSYEKLPVLIFLAAGGIVMLSAGCYFRKSENRINSILKILNIASEVSLTELQQSTGYTREMIERAVLIINKKLPFYYVIDRESDTVTDGRLKTRLARIESCESCGKTINRDYPVSSYNPPACPYCGAPFKAEKWNSLKREAISEIQRNDNIKERNTIIPGKPEKFSQPVFIILIIFFWPAAIAYYLYYKSSGR